MTVLTGPALAVSNVAVPPAHCTASLGITPVSVQLTRVALVVPSYGLPATTTTGVNVTARIDAVVVAVVDVSVYSPHPDR